jgi:hypothetical protein
MSKHDSGSQEPTTAEPTDQSLDSFTDVDDDDLYAALVDLQMTTHEIDTTHADEIDPKLAKLLADVKQGLEKAKTRRAEKLEGDA